MKTAAKCAALLSLVVLSAACTKDERVSDIPVINFEVAEERPFDVAEILEDPKLVRLETSEKAFIDYARFGVGEKYIIAVSREAILQFTGEGAFIRILAQRGRGPQEFEDVRAFAMDENEQKLYIDHKGSGVNVLVFDLNSGTFDRVIKKPLAALGIEDGFWIEGMMVVSDSLYCIPARNYAGESALYIQRTSGQFVSAFPRDDKVITSNVQVSAYPFIAREPGTSNIRYMSRDKDTVFSLSGTKKEAYVAITYEGKFIYTPNFTEITGNMMGMLGEGASTILFGKLTGTVKEMGNSRSASEGWAGFYVADKRSFTPVRISRLMMDELEFPRFHWSRSNDKVFVTIPAVDFKEMLGAAIENSSRKPEALERWRSLDDEISENDNPILLVGNMK